MKRIKDLYSRILVAIRSAESISERIEKLRDEELQPQIIELLYGMMNMWKAMLESHEIQNKIMNEVKLFTCPTYGKFSNNNHRLATLQVEAELQNWRTCFRNYLTAQKQYVGALYSWLSKFIVPEKSGEEEEEADVMPNESTKDCVDEEDIGGFAGSWGHHSSPNTVPATIFQASIRNEFIYCYRRVTIDNNSSPDTTVIQVKGKLESTMFLGGDLGRAEVGGAAIAQKIGYGSHLYKNTAQFSGNCPDNTFIETLRERLLKPTLSTIISDNSKSKDILMRIIALGLSPESTMVEKVMTPNPECANIDTPIVDALHTMHHGKFLHLPVVDREGIVVAIIDVLHISHAVVASVGSSGIDADAASTMMQNFWDSAMATSPADDGNISGR
ncbi:hypothetical protein L2E82_03528 [Cichorium intybus]|uniref:Uncharacterized protein n=1 Tax=Cichorium intybus TaxID=13427 RepID=A0ACB9H668_CICIN|nr:hypothetical protein L2E82_03528 [Cichorium intybus]